MTGEQSKGYVYAVTTDCGTYVKFGWAKDPSKRLTQMQTGCPHKLSIAATAQWPREYEKAIHVYLAGSQAQGEWFASRGEAEDIIQWMLDDDTAPLALCVGQRRPSAATSGFLHVDFAWAARLEMPMRARRVLDILCSMLRGGNVARITMAEIAEATGIAKPHVSTSMKLLTRHDLAAKESSGVYLLNPYYSFMGNAKSFPAANRRYRKAHRAAVERSKPRAD